MVYTIKEEDVPLSTDFKCHQCNKKFICQSTLKRHITEGIYLLYGKRQKTTHFYFYAVKDLFCAIIYIMKELM